MFASIRKFFTKKDKFERKYRLEKQIGSGAYSTVRLAEEKSTKKKVAVKCVIRQKMDEDDEKSLMTEISILEKITHPNVIRLFGHYEDKIYHYLVLELMGGGELLDRIIKRVTYSEDDARVVVQTVADVLKYCHDELNIVHRDLKPENILMTDKTPSAVVKLADFGFAKHVPKEGCVTACGTPGYVAPEIISGKRYGNQCDVWSLGVLMYILLCGYPPFYAPNRKEMFRKIRAVNYEFGSPYWDNISDDAKDLVRKIFTSDFKARIPARDIVNHPWITQSDNAKGKPVDEKNFYELKVFNARSHLRTAFTAAIAAGRIHDIAEMIKTDRLKLIKQ